MSLNWSIITNKLYGILKGSSDKILMYDAKGNQTLDPEQATRFFAVNKSFDPNLDSYTFLTSAIDDGQNSLINLKTPNLSNEKDWNKIWLIRNHIRKSIGQKEGIKVVWQVFDKEIDPKEEVVNNIKESKDVSKWFGSSKSSFQRIGEAKLIVRHSDAINQDKHGARTRHVKAIFVENRNGERFAYPYMHLIGARAFARHISNGGNNHDPIAESIFKLSADYVSLKKSSRLLQENSGSTEFVVLIKEQIEQINRRLKTVQGPKGYLAAESVLADSTLILDEAQEKNILLQLAEQCSCHAEDENYNDLKTAARYIGHTSPFPSKPEFKWKHLPNISNYQTETPTSNRLSSQINELSNACEDSRYAARFGAIAEIVSSGKKPSSIDLEFVREAISSLVNAETNEILPEERELDQFLNEYSTERLFSDTTIQEQDSTQPTPIRFIPGTPGEVIDQDGPYYLTWFPDRYDRHTVKNEYEIMKKSGDSWEYIDNLNMRYDHPEAAKTAFREKVKQLDEGWSIAKPIDKDRYQERHGLEGPFMTKIGKVVYYDPKEGKYYDPDSDFYIDHDDYAAMNESDSAHRGFIRGDKVRHQENQQIGIIVGEPENDEYPVKYDSDDEIYFTPSADLELVDLEEDQEANSADLDEDALARIKNLAGI